MNDETKDIVVEENTGEPVSQTNDQTLPPKQEQEPVAEEPVAEELVTEEPTVEEPVTEEPAVEVPVAEELVTEEPVTEEPAVEEPVAEEPVTEEPAAEEKPAEPAPEEQTTPADEAAAPAPKKDVLGEMVAFVKKALAFAQKHIFTTQVCNITLIGLSAITMVLCLLQLVVWGAGGAKAFPTILTAMTSLSISGIVEMALLLVFAITLLSNTIRGIVALFKKGHTPDFSAVATLIAYYAVSMAAAALLEDAGCLMNLFPVVPLLNFILIAMIVYSVIKMFEIDVRNRWSSVLFSVLALVVILIVNDQTILNFFAVSVDGGAFLPIRNYNFVEYIHALKTEGLYTIESQLVQAARASSMPGLVTILQMIGILLTNLMPYALMSLLPYFVYGIAGKAYDQYYQLHACKKACVTMLITFLLSAVAGAVLMVIGDTVTGTDFAVTLEYTNIAIVALALIGVVVLLSLPWSIYKAGYKRHYAVYQKSKGENV